MWKEKITDLAIYVLIVFVSGAIGFSISQTLGWNEAYKVYAPTIPPQADPFYADLTA